MIITEETWLQVLGWQYGIVVTDGSADRDVVTSEKSFTVTIPGESATVRITETPQDGLKLHTAYCEDVDQDPYEPGRLWFGALDGATLSFDVKPGAGYTCWFIHGPPVMHGALVRIWKVMDADGDLGTLDEFPLGVGWDFSIGVTNGTANRDVVTTDKNGFASFRVTAFAKLEITEVNGSDLLDVSCWDIAGENDFIHGGYAQDGATLAFDTESGGAYGCQFTNLGVGAKAEADPPLAPPTDTLGGTPEPSPDPWHNLVIGLAGLIAGILVLRSPRSRCV